MSARAARAFAYAALFAALACGRGDDEEREESAAVQPASEVAPAAAASDAEAIASDVIEESTVAPAPNGEAEERIGALLDLDPEGEGLDALIRAAREDADPSVRETAVIALGDSDDPRALDALIAATEDASSRVVLAAIDQLGWFDDRRAEDAIRRLADSADEEIAAAAREELADE